MKLSMMTSAAMVTHLANDVLRALTGAMMVLAATPSPGRAATPKPLHWFSANKTGLYLAGASPVDEVIEAVAPPGQLLFSSGRFFQQ